MPSTGRTSMPTTDGAGPITSTNPPGTPPTRSPGRRTRKAALYLIGLIVLVATTVAFVQSYDGLYQWARRYLDDGWARTWPLQIDAWIAVGELALYVAYRDGWPARRKVWPWLAAATGLVVSTVFNIGHLSGVGLAGHLTAAVPPVAAFAGLALGLQVLKSIEQPASAPQPASNAVAADQDHDQLQHAQSRRTDLDDRARTALAENPALTGHQLGQLLRVSERTGRRLLRRAAAAHGSNPDRSNG